MYFQLTEALTRKFIEELRSYWSTHPKYRSMVDAIQGKFSFDERPQRGIIVKSSGGNHVSLSADNYKGQVVSYVSKARIRDKPGLSLEWVREDALAIQKNAGRFPTPPGVYFLDIVDEGGQVVFYVDPLLDVYHEQVLMVDTTTVQLQHAHLDGTLRLYEQPSGFKLVEGVNYTVVKDVAGLPTGELQLTQPVTGGRWLQADYRWPDESKGPFTIYEMHANNQAIPGVVLAFGRRVEVGDQLAVIVEEVRRPTALAYGGRWELSVEFDVFARDVYDQREIADQSVVYLWGIARSRLSSEGLEIMTISLGGESEEIYDETGDDYFYNASFSISCETEWEVHVPLNVFIRQVAPLTVAQAAEIAAAADDGVAGQGGNIQMKESLGLEDFRDPFWSGRTGTLEMFK